VARIAGINLPAHKHIWIALTSIYGIGRTRSLQICEAAGIEINTKVNQLTEDQAEKLREQVAQFEVEGEMRERVKVQSVRLKSKSESWLKHQRKKLKSILLKALRIYTQRLITQL